MQYLEHYISGQGLEPIPEKLESLQQMPAPTDLTEVRKFLGFVGYYRKFIPKYSDIARPLTNLTRKDIPFQWSKACQVAFEMLKEYLFKEPILKYPNRTNLTYYTQMQVNMHGLEYLPKLIAIREKEKNSLSIIPSHM